MPKVLPEYLELRRQQILDASAACFTRRGFHQSTMQDICDAANLSPGAIYRYFHSKEEIIQAMCARGQSEDAGLIGEAMTRGDTLEIFDELIRIFFNNIDDRELCALTVELLSEARRNDFILESMRDGAQAIRAALVQIVIAGQKRGEINPELAPEAVARVMVSVYQGLLHQRIIEPELSIEPYAEVVRSLFGGRFWTGVAQRTSTATA